MIIDFIPFQIGMHYENWEFDLEPMGLNINKTYDKYVFFKKEITELFSLEVECVYLYFSLDILFKVEVIFKPSSHVQDFIHLATKLENKFGRQVLTSNEELLKLSKTWKDSKKYLILEHRFKLNQVYLLLVDRNY